MLEANLNHKIQNFQNHEEGRYLLNMHIVVLSFRSDTLANFTNILYILTFTLLVLTFSLVGLMEKCKF